MKLSNIAVLGSGIMGHGIAQISAMAGYNVALRDIKQEFLDNAMGKIKWSLEKMESKGRINPGEAGKIISKIQTHVELEDAIKGSQMVIEAVPEIIDLKKKVYAELDSIADESVIFASNTSTLPITEIAQTTSRPDRFVGVHFFNPPQLMKLVEVIPGQKTTPSVRDQMLEFVKSLGKETVLCRRDIPGFIVNRLFIPLVHEACFVMERQGIKLEEMDSAVKYSLGFPMGIFELADFTGMDVIHKATVELYLRDKKVLRPHPKIKELFDAGKLGQKSGEGFYKYSKEKYERVELSEKLAANCDPIQMLGNIGNNAAWLITNGASDMVEIEKACKLGLGLRKPLFETMKKYDLNKIVDQLKKLEERHGSFYSPDPMLSGN